MKNLKANRLTVFDGVTGHYSLPPQRGCFERCERCYNLSEADSSQIDNCWTFKPECLFCVQRLIDLLGYYEHNKVPSLSISGTPKTRKRKDTGGIYEAIMRSVRPSDEDLREVEERGVFDDCVGED